MQRNQTEKHFCWKTREHEKRIINLDKEKKIDEKEKGFQVIVKDSETAFCKRNKYFLF